jgi:hypothetical protein
VNTYCHIKSPYEGVIPFKLWDFQEGLLRDWGRKQASITLKSRIMGLDWLAVAYCLHTALFSQGRAGCLFHRRLADAEVTADRVEFMISHLPPWLRCDVIERHDKTFEFANGSSIYCAYGDWVDREPDVLMLSEYAFFREGNRLHKRIECMQECGGEVNIYSTVNSKHDNFAKLWFEATRGANSYIPVFLPWYLHPGRDTTWLLRHAKDMAPEQIAQAYPSTWEEAFSG